MEKEMLLCSVAGPPMDIDFLGGKTWNCTSFLLLFYLLTQKFHF